MAVAAACRSGGSPTMTCAAAPVGCDSVARSPIPLDHVDGDTSPRRDVDAVRRRPGPDRLGVYLLARSSRAACAATTDLPARLHEGLQRVRQALRVLLTEVELPACTVQ